MKSFKKLGLHKGFTLVELGIVVAIAAVVIGIALLVVPSLLSTTKVSGEIGDISLTVSKIQRIYSSRTTYAGVDQATIAGLQVVPDNYVSGTTVLNRWGGNVTFGVLAAGLVGANDAVTYTTTAIPSDACVGLAQGLVKVMRVIQVGSTVVMADHSALDLTKLGTACNASPTATMTMTFGK